MAEKNRFKLETLRGDSDTFDRLIANVERWHLEQAIDDNTKARLERLVLKIERYHQDISEKRGQKPAMLLNVSSSNLQQHLDEVDGKKYYTHIESRLNQHLIGLHEAFSIIGGFGGAERGLSEFHSVLHRTFYEIAGGNSEDSFITKMRLEIDLVIKTEIEFEALHVLWTLMKCISQVNGAFVDLSQIRRGSLIARINAFFDSEEGKKEGERLLEGTRNFVHAKLNKEHKEIEKDDVEKEKLSAETDKINKEAEALDPTNERLKGEIEVELLQIKAESERVALERAQLKLLRERVKTFKELLAEEIISTTEFRMLISGILFLEKKGETVKVGPSFDEMNEIEDNTGSEGQ